MNDQKKPLALHEKAIPVSIALIVLGLLSLFISYAVRDERILLVPSLIICFFSPIVTGLVVLVQVFLMRRGIITGTVKEKQVDKFANGGKTCSSCNTENPPGNNFCEQCGNTL